MAGANSAGIAICATLQEPFLVDGREFRISGCCGVTLLVPGDCDVEEALIRADTALYRAKESGRVRGRRLHAGDARDPPAPDPDRAGAAPARDAGADRPRLPADHRPRHRRARGPRGAGALARRVARPRSRPTEFIPIAEQINVIERDQRQAARRRRGARPRAGPSAVRLSFNLSAVQLCTAGSARRILALLDRQPARPRPAPDRSDRDRPARRFRDRPRQSPGASRRRRADRPRRFRRRPRLHLLSARDAVRRGQAGRRADRHRRRLPAQPPPAQGRARPVRGARPALGRRAYRDRRAAPPAPRAGLPRRPGLFCSRRRFRPKPRPPSPRRS